MQEYVYYPKGTCSREMHIFFEDGIVKDLQVIGGCNGNLKGISALVKNRPIDEIIFMSRSTRSRIKRNQIKGE